MIAHIDADSFFASVLTRKNPRLVGKPLLALGMGGGCVIAASYEAKAFGIKTGMPLKEALRLCPQAISEPSDFAETSLASNQIESMIRDLSPVVEQMSIDEWFVDLSTLVGGIPFDPYIWAKDLQTDIGNQTAISVSIGVAPTKLLAKMAGEYRKPAGVTVIEKRDLEVFLSDRPAAAIPGIGRKREVHTKAEQWLTAWDIANADSEKLRKFFGITGLELQKELLGERVFQVAEDNRPPQSISRCRSFRMTDKSAICWGYVLQHLSYCTLKMRKNDLACRGISVWVRDGSYHHRSAHLKLPQPSDTEDVLKPFARKCFVKALSRFGTYTQAGLCLWNLGEKGATQFSLFQSPKNTMCDESLQSSLDGLRKRYGRDVLMPGSALPIHKKRTRGLDVSMFE